MYSFEICLIAIFAITQVIIKKDESSFKFIKHNSPPDLDDEFYAEKLPFAIEGDPNTLTHYRTTTFAMRANIPSLDILIVSRHEYDANIRIARSTVLTKGDRRLTKKPWQDHLFNLLIFGSFQGKVFLTRGGASCNVGDAELKGISVQRC
jgi:hypothetical protein